MGCIPTIVATIQQQHVTGTLLTGMVENLAPSLAGILVRLL